jgi:hypothetical protein
MKKAIILFFIVLAKTMNVSAQDLIVTNSGDSINCKITKQQSEYIYFYFKFENRELRHSLLARKDIKHYQLNYYKSQIMSPAEARDKIKTSSVRFGATLGYSYRIAKIDKSLPKFIQDYLNDLRSGISIGADFHYFTSESFGFGFRYNRFISNNQIDNVSATYNNGTSRYGTMSDDITIQTFCPSVMTRFASKNPKTYYTVGISFGLQTYYNKATVIDDFVLKGTTAAFSWDLGLDYKINPNTVLCLGLSLTTGILTEVTKEAGGTKETIKYEDDEKENLSRVELSVGLRFMK